MHIIYIHTSYLCLRVLAIYQEKCNSTTFIDVTLVPAKKGCFTISKIKIDPEDCQLLEDCVVFEPRTWQGLC